VSHFGQRDGLTKALLSYRLPTERIHMDIASGASMNRATWFIATAMDSLPSPIIRNRSGFPKKNLLIFTKSVT